MLRFRQNGRSVDNRSDWREVVLYSRGLRVKFENLRVKFVSSNVQPNVRTESQILNVIASKFKNPFLVTAFQKSNAVWWNYILIRSGKEHWVLLKYTRSSYTWHENIIWTLIWFLLTAVEKLGDRDFGLKNILEKSVYSIWAR